MDQKNQDRIKAYLKENGAEEKITEMEHRKTGSPVIFGVIILLLGICLALTLVLVRSAGF